MGRSARVWASITAEGRYMEKLVEREGKEGRMVRDSEGKVRARTRLSPFVLRHDGSTFEGCRSLSEGDERRDCKVGRKEVR